MKLGNAKVISFINLKGGVGKATASVNQKQPIVLFLPTIQGTVASSEHEINSNKSGAG